LPSQWELASLMDYSGVGYPDGDGLLPEVFVNRHTGNLFFNNSSNLSLDFTSGLLEQNVSGTAVCHLGVTVLTPDFVSKTSPDTIVDKRQHLMWQDDATLLNQTFTWSEALQHCEALVLDGHDDWRLPNATEAYYLMAEIMRNGRIPLEYRSGYRVEWWSSTTAPDSADAAFSMWAGYLQGMHNSSSKIANKLARCVRTMPHALPVIAHQGDVVMLNNETVTLEGSASYAYGGGIASYQWFCQTLSLSSSATATPRIVNPPVGEHLVRLTVTDSNYVEASSAFIVTVLPANQPPVAVFDIPDTVYYGDVVQLDGTQSYDAA